MCSATPVYHDYGAELRFQSQMFLRAVMVETMIYVDTTCCYSVLFRCFVASYRMCYIYIYIHNMYIYRERDMCVFDVVVIQVSCRLL